MSEELISKLKAENETLRNEISGLERKKWELDKKIFELKVLYEIAKETTTTQNIGSMLKVFLSMTMGTFGISRGLIVIDEGQEKGWQVITSRGINYTQKGNNPLDFSEFSFFKTLKETCMFEGDNELIKNEFKETQLFQWLKDVPIMVWIPIISDNTVIGGIFIGKKISGETFNVENLNLLSIIASNCALNIKNARLFQGNLEKERIQRENLELKRLDKKKSEFVNMVAHELRTPLTSISGFSELMVKKSDTKSRDSLKKFASIIFQESDRLRRIINDLLDLSRIKSGKVDMDMKTNSFDKVLEHSLANIQLSAQEKKITIETNIPDTIAPFIFDKDKITQVLLNLLSNAVKYTLEDGKVTVTVKTDEAFLTCSIKDTGVGIPRSDIDKVFEEFHRVNNEVTKGERGTGLGLPITKSIVEVHNGKIWVESKEGDGSIFSFKLPLNAKTNE